MNTPAGVNPYAAAYSRKIGGHWFTFNWTRRLISASAEGWDIRNDLVSDGELTTSVDGPYCHCDTFDAREATI
jgi:hypothetical protein